MDSADKVVFRNSIFLFAWITVWFISYDPFTWLQLPLIKDLFPLPLPNGNLTYYEMVTSIGIIGTIGLIYMLARSTSSTVNRGFHRA